MSRAKILKAALPAIAIAASTACASSPAAPELTSEEQAYQDAIAEALKPATAEEIALAERSDPVTRAAFWSNEYQKNSDSLETTVSFIRALRGIGSYDRIRDIVTVSVPLHPTSHELFLEYGRTLMKQNEPQRAAQAFLRSANLSPETEAAPLAALGVALDRMEEHQKAQEAYEIALQRDPNRVSTLSNYGLSLALTGRLSEAEAALRKAAELPGADIRVRQNLALILGLQGRYDEMAAVDPTAPRRSITANQNALQEMIAPGSNTQNLRNISDVLIDLERTPAAAQEMPAVPEAAVASESMSEPTQANREITPEPSLAGDSEAADPAPLLRPALRGAQGL
ncbi:MAG: hypothetical protein AAFR51_01820 [Pseudomonadota bacterium]